MGMRILIVDDQQDMLSALGNMLARTDHTVTLEQDSKRALALIEEQDFDILVTDMMMPGIGGVDIIRNVRPKKPDLWIVAISGGSEVMPVNTVLRISEAYGADRVLFKPFRKAELLAALQRDDS
jgi:DNA-binding response OmpR family regulator